MRAWRGSRARFWLCAAPAQAQQVRLAAPADCLVNPGCGVGLKSVYGLDVAPAFVPLTVADAGIGALDDGARRSRGRVLVEPAGLAPRHRHAARRPPDGLSRPRRAGRAARAAARVRAARRARHPPPAERGVGRADRRSRCERSTRRWSTAASRGGRRRVRRRERARRDGARRRRGPADRHRLHGLRRERDARLPVRRGAARGRLPRAGAQRRRAAAGGGGASCGATGSTSIRPTTARCCATSSGRRPRGCAAGLRRTLARIDAEPMRLSRAQNRNVFVTKTDTASRLGLARISDLARYWGG